jgi:CheY-like chemotaxis protein
MCEPVDLVVTDLELPRLNGIELIVKLRAHGLKTPVLVVTGVTAAASIAALPGGPVPGVGARGLLFDRRACPGARSRRRVRDDPLRRRCVSAQPDGVIAQLHRLQPVAVLVAMATVGQSDNPRAVAESLGPFGFDDIAWRPIQPAAIALLVEEYCSAWGDLVTVEEDIIRVSRLRRRGREHDHYLNELSTRVAAALQAIGEACFEYAVLDLSHLDHLVPTELFALLKGLARAATAIGITLLTVVNEALAADLHGLKESFSDGSVGGPASVFRFFTTVATARAAIG